MNEAQVRKSKTKATKARKALFKSPKPRKSVKRAEPMISSDTDDSSICHMASEDDDQESFSSLDEVLGLDAMAPGSFYLVKFETEHDKNVKHYIGELLDFNERDDIYSFSSLRLRSGKFVYPDIPDLTKVQKSDIIKLVTGMRVSTTKRQNRAFTFNVDVTQFNLF